MTNYNTVPVTYMRDGVQRYLEQRIPPDSFLRTLFSNDLHDAYGKADAQNQACMFEWVRFMVNQMPAASWGSPETVAAWPTDVMSPAGTLWPSAIQGSLAGL